MPASLVCQQKLWGREKAKPSSHFPSLSKGSNIVFFFLIKGMLDAMNETNAGPTPLWLNGQIFTLFYRLSVQRWEVH